MEQIKYSDFLIDLKVADRVVCNKKILKCHASWQSMYPFLHTALCSDEFNLFLLTQLHDIVAHYLKKPVGMMKNEDLVFFVTFRDLLSQINMNDPDYYEVNNVKVKLSLIHLEKLGFIEILKPIFYNKCDIRIEDCFCFTLKRIEGNMLHFINHQLETELSKKYNF